MIYVVVGMHRSGTSAVAGMLHAAGVEMGCERTFKPLPNKENPMGFFENIDFRRMNDQILRRSGYEVKSWTPEDVSIRLSFLHEYQIRSLLRKYSKKKLWGWKDPRNCLTLGSWLHMMSKSGLLSVCRIIYVYREPISVAKSLYERGDTDEENGIRLWVSYNSSALTSLTRYNVPVTYIKYEKLISEPELYPKKILEYLGLTGSKLSADFIDPSLNRSSASRDQVSVSESLPDGALLLLDKLNSRELQQNL